MAWDLETNIKGPVGPVGPPGPGVVFKGTVPTYANLPPTPANGDMYITEDDGHGWVWDGTVWVDAGQMQGSEGPMGPAGPQGATGAASTVPGPPNTLAIGTVSTVAPGGAATSTITGTSPNQTLNLGIPSGLTGSQGIQGIQGPAGADGATTPPATVVPLMDGTGAVGTTTKYAREDHRHPTDTTRAASTHTHPQSDITNLVSDLALKAPLASPALTGNPTAPTPSVGDADTSIATTAFVAASFAPLASPTFTGDPKSVTPATSDNDTSIATTAYVKANLVGIAPTAEARNRIVNPAMQVSQEKGSVSSPVSAGQNYWPADQWVVVWATSPGTASTQQVQSVTPNGSKDRVRMTVGTAKASLAATDYLQISTRIEGVRMADFRYGSANAKQSILRFGWKSPAGTYAVSVRNDSGGGPTHTYIATFVISAGQANTDTTQMLVIPGATVGVWATDRTLGAYLYWSMAAGTSNNGTAGSWGAGSGTSTAACTNGMAGAGNVFEIFDVGWHLDPLATGVAPAWVAPDEAQEKIACQRYYAITYITARGDGSYTPYLAPTLYFPTQMRVPPTASTIPGSQRTNIAGVGVNPLGDADGGCHVARVDVSAAAAGGFYVLDEKVVLSARI